MKTNYINLFLVGLLFFGLISCSDFLTENPYGSVIPSTFYETEQDAIMASTSCYTQLNNPTDFWAPGLDAVGDIQSDDIFPFLGWTGLMPLYTFDENHEAVKGVWTAAYKGISRCNTCIDNVSPMTIKDQIKNEALGQARFIRAYWYFRLVRLYGSIPLITKEYISLDNLYPPRVSENEVYTQIINDLKFAATHLPKQWSSGETGRITQGAAMSYLALVYLNLKEWGEAEKWSAEVMKLEGEGVYELLTNYSTIHLEENENNKESILERQYSTEFSTNWRPVYLGPRGLNLARHAGYGWLQVSKSIVDEFEEGDLRFKSTFFQEGEKMIIGLKEITYSGEWASAYGPTKHDIKKGNLFYGTSRQSGINTIVMRYAEVILFRAEALNEMGRSTEALPLLNRIRARAGLDPQPAIGQDVLRKAIRHERRTEFAFEDIRGWDIIRWGIQEEVMAPLAGSKWKKGKCELWPLPTFVLTENPSITENNPGW